MSKYHRSREGGVYFFTLVTCRRVKILTTDLARRCLRETIAEVRKDLPFQIAAFVLLPDHLQAVWTLPPGPAVTKSWPP